MVSADIFIQDDSSVDDCNAAFHCGNEASIDHSGHMRPQQVETKGFSWANCAYSHCTGHNVQRVSIGPSTLWST